MYKEFTYESEVGVSVTYWEIVGYQIDWFQKILVVTVGGWVSKKVREDGAKPLVLHSEEFSERAVVAANQRNIQKAEQALKNQETSVTFENPESLQFDFEKDIKVKALWDKLSQTAFFLNKFKA